MSRFFSKSETETEEIGAKIASQYPKARIFALYGSMGMGKTAFVRGFVHALGIEDRVSSPTFAIVHHYGKDDPVFHFDMYRITTPDDLYSTGFYDYLDQRGKLIIEWTENVQDFIPLEDCVKIVIGCTENENERVIEII